MNEFSKYHPIVNFLYFITAIIFSCLLFHPVTLAISIFSAFVYYFYLHGKNAVKIMLTYFLPLFLITACINPLFNHMGETVIMYWSDDIHITLEALYYGAASALMLLSVVILFMCFNEVITSDKLMYILGRFTPSLSLIFSMILRFVPQYTKQIRKIVNAKKCIGQSVDSGGIIKRAENGLDILSAVTTWGLENSINTAESMKARGFGIAGRKTFLNSHFTRRDLIMSCCIIVLTGYILIGKIMGACDVTWYPLFSVNEITAYRISVYLAYLLLMTIPVNIEVTEVIKWKLSGLKM